jgi:gas vesicle protein
MSQKENNEDDSPKKGHPIKASIISASIAALVTYFLYGTENGERARKQISKAANATKDKVQDKMHDLKKSASKAPADLVETGKEIFEDMSTLFDEKREQMHNLSSKDLAGLSKRLRERWEETKKDIEETLDDSDE